MSFPWKTVVASTLIGGGSVFFARNQFNARNCTPPDYSTSMNALTDAENLLRDEFPRDPCGSASSMITLLDGVGPAYRSSYFEEALVPLKQLAQLEERVQEHYDCPLEPLARTYIGARLDDAHACAENKEGERRDRCAKEGVVILVVGLSALGFGVNRVREHIKERSMGIPG